MSLRALSPKNINQNFSLILIVAVGLTILAINMGVRQSLGLFLPDLAIHFQSPLSEISLGFAVQNLMWGVISPLAGIAAERFGTARILMIGGLLYALGIIGLAVSDSLWMYHMSNGILVGVGIGATTYPLVLAAVSSHINEKKRSFVLGIVSAGGSLGQFLFAILAQYASQKFGWQGTLWLFAAAILLLIIISPILTNHPQHHTSINNDKLPLSDKRFMLLAIGFFVCGFHVAFISVHLPNLVASCGLPPNIAANSLALIGIVNVLGTIFSGWLGDRYHKPYILSIIYVARAILILVFLLLPKTVMVFYIFSVVMGVLWLPTVPLTSGAVAQFFGTKKLATLFGLIMFGHQVGAFFGAWLGGMFFDMNDNYDLALIVSVVLSIVAALVHLAIPPSVSFKARVATIH